MRRVVALLLGFCVFSHGLAARPFVFPVEGEPFSVILEQQPLVKCLSVFSDISLRIATQWFIHSQTHAAGAPADRAHKQTPSGTATKDFIGVSSGERQAPRALRGAGISVAPALQCRAAASGSVSIVVRTSRYRTAICVLFLLLLLKTVLARGGLGEYAAATVFRVRKPGSRQGTGFFIWHHDIAPCSSFRRNTCNLTF